MTHILPTLILTTSIVASTAIQYKGFYFTRAGAGDNTNSQFMELNLIDGGNAILHGYTPQLNDVVEWYVRHVDCDQPDKKCTFELAIRKKQ